MEYDHKHFEFYKALEVRRFSMHWWSNRYYAKLLRRYAKAGAVLEIGCGTGFFLAELARYFEAYGIDISDFALNHARHNCPSAEIQYMQAQKMSFPSDFFNAIVSRHVFEHLDNPGAVLRECYRVLKPGGIMLFTVPNMDSVAKRWKGTEWYGYRDNTHISMLYPAKWLRLTTESGMDVQRAYSDGLWDAPYLTKMPVWLQRCIFGFFGGFQAIFVLSFMPIPFGEALIVVAKKP
jgi:ubiquinone/menaquinone biosynthesis C-methylase UbiE